MAYALQVQQANTRGVHPGLDRHGTSPARHRSGSNNLLSMQRQPSSSGQLYRQPSGSHASSMHRHPGAAGMQRNSSALLPQGSSPAVQRRSEQSPAPHRASASPAMQRPGNASSGGGMSQRQSSMSNSAIFKHGGLAALLRQASSPAVQRPEGAAAMMPQGSRDSVPRQSRCPDLQRAESSAAASQRQGSRPIRGTSPALQRPGSLPSPVVAADFARKGSNGLSAFPSGDLAGRSERVRHLLPCIIGYTMTLCSLSLATSYLPIPKTHTGTTCGIEKGRTLKGSTAQDIVHQCSWRAIRWV